MHFVPEQLTLHLTSVLKDKNDTSPDWFHITSTRPNRGIGPKQLNVPFKVSSPYHSIKEAKQLAAKMLGVDYTAIELVHYLKHYAADVEASAPLIGSST